jgi:hypothetical protein
MKSRKRNNKKYGGTNKEIIIGYWINTDVRYPHQEFQENLMQNASSENLIKLNENATVVDFYELIKNIKTKGFAAKYPVIFININKLYKTKVRQINTLQEHFIGGQMQRLFDLNVFFYPVDSTILYHKDTPELYKSRIRSYANNLFTVDILFQIFNDGRQAAKNKCRNLCYQSN